MSLRLIEIILREEDAKEISNLLKDIAVVEHWQTPLPKNGVLVRILLEAEQSEKVLDLLEKNIVDNEGYRVVILPVAATLPRESILNSARGKLSERIGREELYENIKEASQCSWVYLLMIAISTIVAIVGLHNNSVATIIGAMVIAPMIGPSMAMALGTTLGDFVLLRFALFTALVGIVVSLVISVAVGLILTVDTSLPEVVMRTRVGLGDIAVAFAAGCAGALAFSTGVSAVLIGVMVAVALLPPLVMFGLLLGGGHFDLATGALSLFLLNLFSINLAAVSAFTLQGIHPQSWWKKDRAVKATYLAIAFWVVMLAVLIVLILTL